MKEEYTTNNTFAFSKPKHVGKYCIGGEYSFCIMFTEKPNIIHRYFMKLFLGWKWTDIKQSN